MASFTHLDGAAFDYVVVGAGNSGCVIASTLAKALPQCRILLVEAGPDDSADPDQFVPGLTLPKFGSARSNWLYETEPQTELNGRTIVYPRGRGMGGCSANNFMAWVKGPDADYDDWADLVGDSWWRWANVKGVLNELESFSPACPPGMEAYVQPTPGAHGYNGPISVEVNTTWQDIIPHCLTAAQQAGYAVNGDANDGRPMGVSIAQFSVKDGVRVTSATAFLDEAERARRGNLTIVFGALCSRVVIEDGRVVGVELLPAVSSSASPPETPETPVRVGVRREAILTAGTFQSAQLLLLSGVGPAADLAALDIAVAADVPGVGQRIRDHSALACEYVLAPGIAGHNAVLRSPARLQAARDEYAARRSGPLAVYGASAALVFAQLPPVFASPEFARLDAADQRFLAHPARPATEIWLHSGPLFYRGDACPPDAAVLVIEALHQNCRSEGSLRLRSRDPRAPPRLDPRYLSDPLDRRVALETLRAIRRLARTPALRAVLRTPLLVPAADDDAALDAFIRDNLTQGFHSMGSCVMGRPGDSHRVVDARFAVDRVRGLRVADMSVCPILTTNHTQVNAYLIGYRCAQVVLEDARAWHPSANVVRARM